MNPSNAYGFSSVAAPVVYRSLPILESWTPVTRNENDTFDGVKASKVKEASAACPVTRRDPSKYNLPCVMFEGQVSCPMTQDKIDLEELQAKLSAFCKTCDLEKSSTKCEFNCVAEAADGNEQCKFVVSVWYSMATGKYLVQPERHAGCPFFFNQLMNKIGNNPRTQRNQLFRCPALPAELIEENSKLEDESCVDSAIRLATSPIQEQRVLGMEVLADLMAENPRMRDVFKELNGFQRLSEMEKDPNDLVKRAYSRIMVCV